MACTDKKNGRDIGVRWLDEASQIVAQGARLLGVRVRVRRFVGDDAGPAGIANMIATHPGQSPETGLDMLEPLCIRRFISLVPSNPWLAVGNLALDQR